MTKFTSLVLLMGLLSASLTISGCQNEPVADPAAQPIETEPAPTVPTAEPVPAPTPTDSLTATPEEATPIEATPTKTSPTQEIPAEHPIVQ